MNKKQINKNNQILFYEDDAYLFSNWSAHAVEIFGELFPTAEHAYHYKKYDRDYPEIAKRIKSARSPYLCKEITRETGVKDKCRKDWDDIKIDVLREILRAKFKQHEEVRRNLKATGDRQLVENSPVDYFWGCGKDGSGQNWLGKIWMEIRDEIFS